MNAEPRKPLSRSDLLQTILGDTSANVPLSADGSHPVININFTFSGDGPVTLVIGSLKELLAPLGTITGGTNDR